MFEEAAIEGISREGFRKYGRIVEYPGMDKKGDKRNLWKIVHRSLDETGWRIAYLVLRDKTIGRLERHSDSDETFDPVSGQAVIFVSADNDGSNIKLFYLDKPVVVFKGIWHGIVSLSKESHIKVFENANVKCEYCKLKTRLDPDKWIKKKRKKR